MATSERASAFLKAASDGDLTLIKRLVSEAGNRGGRAYDTIMDSRGRNALYLAAGAGKIEICKYLVQDLKLDIDSKNYLGNTPLLIAILERRSPVAAYLIGSGANISYENYEGYTALHYAAQKGLVEILRLLLSKGAKAQPDHDLQAVTPLHAAAFHGNKECMKILLENGADPNSVTKVYSTPLAMSISAMSTRSYECMELLLKAGADPNRSDYWDTTLFEAASISDTRFIIHLLKAGANPNVVNKFGETPLEHAACLGNVNSVRILYPCTSRISHFPDWSVDGIMKHVQSEEERAKREIKRKYKFEVSKAKGREAFERKDYEEAILWYTKANAFDPSDATVYSNRSLCWIKLNQPILALMDVKACVALKPDWPKAHYRGGAALMLIKDYAMALQGFGNALMLDPDNKEILKAYREAEEAESKRNALRQL